MIVYIPVEVPEELANTLLGRAVLTSVGPTSGAEPADEPPADDGRGDPWETYSPKRPAAGAESNAEAVSGSPGVITPEAISAAMRLLQGVGAGGQAADTGAGAGAGAGGLRTLHIKGRSGMTEWTLGRADAPACKCGEPAAYVTGNTNGKDWARWTCPHGAEKGANKCDFNQFA